MYVCLGISCIITVVLSTILYLTGGYIYLLFTTDAEVIAIGMKILHFLVPAFVTYLCIEIYSGALRGVGDCWIPMIMTALGVCVLRVVWILIAVPIRPDILTVVFSYPLTWTITTVLFNIYYYFFSALKKWNVPLPWKKTEYAKMKCRNGGKLCSGIIVFFCLKILFLAWTASFF